MRLSKLMNDAGIRGSPGVDPPVTGIAYDSRRVVPGDLFVAVPESGPSSDSFDQRRVDMAAPIQST